MILAVSQEGGCWWTLSALWKYVGGGGRTYLRESEAGEETVEDRKTTDLPAVRE